MFSAGWAAFRGRVYVSALDIFIIRLEYSMYKTFLDTSSSMYTLYGDNTLGCFDSGQSTLLFILSRIGWRLGELGSIYLCIASVYDDLGRIHSAIRVTPTMKAEIMNHA